MTVTSAITPLTPQVLKVGGSLLAQPQQLRNLFKQLTLTEQPTIVVHGGGTTLDTWLASMGHSVTKQQGLRVSPAEQMPIIVGALAGFANKQLMSYAIAAGNQPVGLSLWEAGITVEPMDKGLGQVGRWNSDASQPSPTLDAALTNKQLPIVSCIGFSATGDWFNVNADDAAAAIALKLSASLTFVTDVPGVYDAEQQLIPEINRTQLAQYEQTGVINGGMKVKVDSAMTVAEQLGRSVRICGCECLTRPEAGTTITS